MKIDVPIHPGDPPDDRSGALIQAPCEAVWICGRGRTRLACQLRHHSAQDFEIEVVRNGRLYGTYRFAERMAAVTYAARLRHTFESNGWVSA